MQRYPGYPILTYLKGEIDTSLCLNFSYFHFGLLSLLEGSPLSLAHSFFAQREIQPRPYLVKSIVRYLTLRIHQFG